MTTPDAHTLISVRGHSQRDVDADEATIRIAVSYTDDTKLAASSRVAALVADLISELAQLNGVVLTAQTSRAPLTWSTQSIRTDQEYGNSKGIHGPTGRHIAAASISIAVRDFTLLARIESILIARDSVAIHVVHWSVDDDNPEWARVRADAIRAALLKGQDYAAALGGTVIGVDHVADAGLLGGNDVERRGAMFTGAARRSHGGGSESSSLDPVPQEVSATIEARLTATIGPLPRH